MWCQGTMTGHTETNEWNSCIELGYHFMDRAASGQVGCISESHTDARLQCHDPSSLH